MRKKIRLSAATLHVPRVLFLDEPFEGMDAASARITIGILEQMAKGGAAIFLTSHRLDYVERISTHLLVIEDGRVLMACTREEFRRAFEPSTEEADDVGRLESLILKISGSSRHPRHLSWLGCRDSA